MGLAYISTLVLSLTGALPFSCFTSVIVAYGMAGEMVKLAENNLMSEWGGVCWAVPRRTAWSWSAAHWAREGRAWQERFACGVTSEGMKLVESKLGRQVLAVSASRGHAASCGCC